MRFKKVRPQKKGALQPVIELHGKVLRILPESLNHHGPADQGVAQRDLEAAADGQVDDQDDEKEDAEPDEQGHALVPALDAGQLEAGPTVEVDKAADPLHHTAWNIGST